MKAKAILIFTGLFAGLLINTCTELRAPSVPPAPATPSHVITNTPTPLVTPAATQAVTQSATATSTQTANWVLAELPVPVTDAYDVHAQVMGNIIYVAYQTGAGAGKQLNTKSFSPAAGWQDYDTNIAVSYSGGNPWYVMGLMGKYAVAVDSAGYVYAYYSNYTLGWQDLGVNPIAGPGCTEASIACNYQNTAFEDIYVAYIDTNDNNTLKAKRIDTLGSTIYSWQDVMILPVARRIYKQNPTGSFWITGRLSWITRTYSLAFADADANTMVSSRFIHGTEMNFWEDDTSVISTVGAPSFLRSIWVGYISVAYSDQGLGGAAVVKRWNGSTWVDVGPPVSSGQAKYISMDPQSEYLIGYADAANNDNLTVKKWNASGAVWQDLAFPGESIESCSVGYYESNKAFAAYITSAADGRKLKIRYMP